MQVTLDEHGGFAPGIRQAPFTVGEGDLDAGAAERLRELVDAALHQTPGGGAAVAGRDMMTYAVTVTGKAQAPVTLRATDAEPGSAVMTLVDWLQRHRAASR